MGLSTVLKEVTLLIFHVTYSDGVDNSGSLCNKSCDVCSANTNMTPVDHSVGAVSVVKCLESMQQLQTKATCKVSDVDFSWIKS